MRHYLNTFCYLVLAVILSVSCDEKKAHPDMEGALWIQDTMPLPDHDSLFYGNHPAPIFRKEFTVRKDFRSARLLISAAGYYRFFINGTDSENNILSPSWTDYSQRVYYSEYDITESIVKGQNCAGVSLGNGFYNPLPLKMWGHLNLRENLTVGKPCFVAKIIIEYNDGSVQEIITDDSWKFSYGPVRRNDVYLGVVYNALYEQSGWNTPGFEDTDWGKAVINPGPGGQLLRRFFPPVVVVDTIIPVDIYGVEDNIWLVDMGVNFTGVYGIMLKGKPGDSVVFRFGERIYESGKLNPMTAVCGQIKRKGMGGPGAPAIAWQTDTYIFGEDSVAYFSPEFTYHTCRYIEIKGLDYKPRLSQIKGLYISTDLQSNSFHSSSDLIDSIQDATLRTFRSNLIGIQSDCAAREKFGYGGDLNATSEAFIYNFNMRDFYRKTVYDWVDAVNDSIFVDTAPYVGINYCGLSWESAFLITQYYLYLYYNDTDIVEGLYDFNRKWMDKVAKIHPAGVVDAGLSDHESLENVPVELTGTAHYLLCARIMKVFAQYMDDDRGFEKYSDLESELSALLLNNFWLAPKYEVENKQVLYSVLLYFDIVPEEDIAKMSDSLLYCINKAGGHFTSGIFGTKYILSALSETGKISDAYNVVTNYDYPGWGHMIKQGATTIWETWKESDNTYSNCHPMFGSVSEWFYRHLAGINPDPEHPGFRKFIISPKFPDGLDSVRCNYRSDYGVIAANWRKERDYNYYYYLEVPELSEAKIMLPYGTRLLKVKDLDNKTTKPTDSINENGKFVLGEGRYEISFVISDQER
ncbi:MAG: family 78 glycoside hydrolase catalytic domain [Bacteroidales bacterium]|nr:family 78 glycoside hydrolase catalytic domain [Bacteroidales bacterium]